MKFESTLTLNGKEVAKMMATATLTHEFQKVFWQHAAYAPNDKKSELSGRFATLDNLLARKVGENEVWIVKHPDLGTYRFEAICLER